MPVHMSVHMSVHMAMHMSALKIAGVEQAVDVGVSAREIAPAEPTPGPLGMATDERHSCGGRQCAGAA